MLQRVHTVQRFLGNMVLFKCNVCLERFPTFHPHHTPEHTFQCTKKCNIAVAEWDTLPGETREKMATLHTGICLRCAKDAESAAKLPGPLQGVGKFSSRNNMDPLWGFPDDVALRKELRMYETGATVVETMLVALTHMQVCVCTFRRRGGQLGTPVFKKISSVSSRT